MVHRIVVVALIVGVGLVSAGGTGVAGTSAKKKPLTKAQFIAQANALCETAGAGIQGIIQSFGKGNGSGRPNQQQAATLIAQAAPIVQRQIDATKKLVAPKRDQSKIKKMLKSAQNALKKLEGDPSLLTKEGGSPFKTADSIARAYGLEGSPGQGPCGGGGGGGGATSTTGSSPGTGGGGGGAPASAGSPAS